MISNERLEHIASGIYESNVYDERKELAKELLTLRNRKYMVICGCDKTIEELEKELTQANCRIKEQDEQRHLLERRISLIEKDKTYLYEIAEEKQNRLFETEKKLSEAKNNIDTLRSQLNEISMSSSFYKLKASEMLIETLRNERNKLARKLNQLTDILYDNTSHPAVSSAA